ncbi:hypothetical protein [Pleionea litopenaei]|uniref:Uncharacterized protein n=1 Tax=Pleionea litopenaei TaxID=3070815 RepID=A0AA51X738_9GAMM|nr:hypothetical protein [Pleionea sp. HL-JVS1]WMS86695.1 hypothetical protein Q9312_15855 [Pleionea sp. HL-JVS1]
MKLSEFSLWAFKLELDLARKFTLFSRCVCAHFERLFDPIETDGIYRVVVKLCGPDERVGTTELSSSVIKYYKEFDFDYFESLNLVAKKRFLLDTLYNALMPLCEMEGWPKAPFHEAYEKVIRENFVNTYTIKKKLSRNKKLSAELIGDHDEKAFNCSIVIKNSDGKELLNEHLFTEEPDEFLFNSRIGDVKWINKTTVVHQSKDKQKLARFDIGDLIDD